MHQVLVVAWKIVRVVAAMLLLGWVSFRVLQVRLDQSASSFRRALRYAYYDWTREMPRSKRVIRTVRAVRSSNPAQTAASLP